MMTITLHRNALGDYWLDRDSYRKLTELLELPKLTVTAWERETSLRARAAEFTDDTMVVRLGPLLPSGMPLVRPVPQ